MDRLRSTVLPIAALSAAAGARTMSGPAMLAGALRDEGSGSRALFPERHMGRRVATGLGAMAVGELIADKLPTTSDRVSPLPLLGRTLAGAAIGAFIARSQREPMLPAAVLGASVAFLSARLTFRARRAVRERTGWPDGVVALLEDLAVYGAALPAARHASKLRR